MGGSSEAPGSDRAARTLRLIIGYDGSEFLGSQRQANGRSVQQELERALELLGGTTGHNRIRGPHRPRCARSWASGRLHRISARRAGRCVRRALNHLCRRDVAVIGDEGRSRIPSPGTTPPGGSTGTGSGSATGNRSSQRQLVVTANAPRPGGHGGRCGDAWWEPTTWLRSPAVAKAFPGRSGQPPHGDHPHRLPRGSFGSTPGGGSMPGDGYGIEIRMVADGFLPQLVRTVVGGLVTIGPVTSPVEWFQELLDRRDRRIGPAVAPAHGLILWRVGYGNDVPDPDPDGTSIVRKCRLTCRYG